MFKLQGLIVPLIFLTGTVNNVDIPKESISPILETFEEEDAPFYDESLRESVIVSRLVMGEAHKSYKLPIKKFTVFTEPEGQSLGFEGGRKGVNVLFGEFTGSSRNFQFSYTYSGLNYKANVSYKTGSTTTSGSLYSAPLPTGAGRWKFQFVLKYETTPTKTDVYKYGVYQYSTIRYSHQYSRNHRWYRA